MSPFLSIISRFFLSINSGRGALFITGSLNTFAQPTNVDTKARIIAYDIRELGEQLMPIGMLVTLDAIFNRVIQNWKKGKTTWVFADEFYLLFRYQYLSLIHI